MVLTIIIACITAVAMVSIVVAKPYLEVKKFKIGLYWVVCLIGAFFMLILNYFTNDVQ